MDNLRRQHGSVFFACVIVACHEPAPSQTPTPMVTPTPVPETHAPAPPHNLFVKRFIANIRKEPRRDGESLGYLRAGAIVRTRDGDTHGNAGCRQGWFELETGGYVCNGSDVTPFEGRRPPERPPAQPDRESPLPYRFGRTRRDNVVMYRRPPTDEEAAEFEGYHIPGVEPVLAEAGESAPTTVATPEPAPAPTPPGAPAAGVEASAENGEPLEPTVATLDSLRGEDGTVVARRMAQGFIVSLDRDIRVRARRYWRTLSNGYVPYAALGLMNGSAFSGISLRGEGNVLHSLPVAFVMSSTISSYTLGRDGMPRRARPPGYHHGFVATQQAEFGGHTFLYESPERLFRADDVRVLRAIARPEGVGAQDTWVDVDLAHQTLVAYEGDTPVYATLVSTGRVRDPEDPLRDARTPTGLYRLRSKHISHTMDGDHAVDGPYSIEDVPYVMYFELAFALHAAFWHDSFGRPKSHGCVNLSPSDAQWIFNWAHPRLPERWHAVYSSETDPGTWVYVHGETPEG